MIVSEPKPLLQMPAPYPWVIVSPEKLTSTPGLMENTMKKPLPSTANKFAPGPEMVRFLSITSSPVVSVIVCPFSEESKSTISPGDDSLIT